MINAVVTAENCVFVFVGHVKAFSRADQCAIIAKAAFEHIDIKSNEMLSNGVAHRSLAQIFLRQCLDRVDVNTIDRTSPGTFITADAVVGIVKQNAARVGR